MTFLDKQGNIKLRYLPPLMILPAIGGLSYGAGLTIGPAVGLFFLCLLWFMNIVLLAVMWDKVEKLEQNLSHPPHEDDRTN